MQTHSIADIVASRLRAIGGIGVLTVAMLAGTAGAVSAASVTPTPINDGNPTCSDFDAPGLSSRSTAARRRRHVHRRHARGHDLELPEL